MAEIILFADAGYGGIHTHLFQSNLDLRSISLYAAGTNTDSWNDNLSSFVIVSGQWRFFRNINFDSPVGAVLGPDLYNWVEDYGIPNDSVSSIQLVAD